MAMIQSPQRPSNLAIYAAAATISTAISTLAELSGAVDLATSTRFTQVMQDIMTALNELSQTTDQVRG